MLIVAMVGGTGETTERRNVLKTIGISPLALPVLGSRVAASAEQTTRIRLGAHVEGFRGESPARIQGETNPTLRFNPGQDYEITVENLDGVVHSFAIVNSQDEVLKQTEVFSETGTTRTVNVTANQRMANYRCLVHPNTESGVIEFGDADSGSETTQTTPRPDWQPGQELDVYNVEPGWKQLVGGWKSAGGDIDADTAFDVRIDVDGVEPAGDTSLAFMVAVEGPDVGFVEVHGAKRDNPPAGGDVRILHGNVATRAFRPELGPASWPEGGYRIYATVLDGRRDAYGWGASAPFDIS